MSLKSLASRRATKRRLSQSSKVTFESFLSLFLNEEVGERAGSLSASGSRIVKPLPKRAGVVAGFVVLVGLVLAVFVLPDPKSDRIETESTETPLPIGRDLECDFTIDATAAESRSVSNFGGLSVQSGLVDCEGEAFIITQTSDAKGEVVSVKKKRA